MDNCISDLLGIVREEIDLYRDLIEHARRKTALLVHGRAEELLESNKIEETYNIKLRILETEMARLCSDLARALNIPRTEFTLLKLAEGAEQAVAAEIKTQTSLFKNLLEQLKAVNQRNMKLIESSMRYSRGLLDLISNAAGSYQATGLFGPLPAIHTTFSHQV
jgi:flagellar biosynthesis/type III secretory pathway chaperone